MPAQATVKMTSHRASSGFTLIEVLVVIMLIAIITTTIALRISASPEKHMHEEVRRMNALVRMASEQALLQGRDVGMSVEETSYSFYLFDQLQQRWLSMEAEAIFRTRTLPANMHMDISVEDSSVTWPEPEENTEEDEDDAQTFPTPQVLMLSSGEITAFDIYFTADNLDAALQLSSTLDGEREVIRHEFGL